MKRRRFLKNAAGLLVPLSLPFICKAQVPDVLFPPRRLRRSSVSAPASYLLQEDFEGTGTPTNWTPTGTVDFDYSAAAIDGAQSLRINPTSAIARVRLDLTTTYSELYLYYKFRVETQAASNFTVCQFYDGANSVVLGQIRFATGQKLQSRFGGVTGSTTVATYDLSTTYHVWVHVVQSSGSDGLCECGFSSDGIRPTSGDNYCTTTTGTATETMRYIYSGSIVAGASATNDLIIDRYRVSQTLIGDNPS